jgi:hypothetical protein
VPRDSWGDITAFWLACIVGGGAVGMVTGILLRSSW